MTVTNNYSFGMNVTSDELGRRGGAHELLPYPCRCGWLRVGVKKDEG